MMKTRPEKFLLSVLVSIIFTSGTYCQKNINRIFNDSLIQISEIPVNSIHSDFGPCVINDSLYFTTFNDKLVRTSDKKLKNRAFYDLYKARIDKNGNPVSERVPVEAFITRLNDGPVSWCAKTGELFITQNNQEQTDGFQKELVRLKIVISKQINGKWGPFVEFPYNSLKYSVGHPAINETGDTLIFSSDIPGGFGETDLYYSVREKGTWGNPVNLGPQINTSGKDEFPFLTDHHFNGRYLIFSSTGRFGNGGFDLYYTRFPAGNNDIVHFESPINTSYDDFAMNIPAQAEYGYLTSNRPGSGNDDIYKFNFKRQNEPRVKTPAIPVRPVERTRELYVVDKASLRPIPNVKIISCDNKVYLTDCQGKITLIQANNCEVIANSFGYSEKKKILHLLTSDNNTIVRDTIRMDLITDQKIVLHNIYYDFDKYDILPEAANELDRLVSLMKQNPEINVQLSSHTDSRGSEVYNLKLSELRAKAAVEYLVSKGISRDRISGKGYGKTKLINVCIEPCTPAQQRENRRTELYIPSLLKGEPVQQVKGDYSNSERLISSLKSGQDSKNKKEISTFGKSSTLNNPGQDKLKYYIILGSFTEETNASKFVRQLQSEGFKAMVLKEIAPVRVGIGFTLLSQAKQSLSDIRIKYENAWIYKN